MDEDEGLFGCCSAGISGGTHRCTAGRSRIGDLLRIPFVAGGVLVRERMHTGDGDLDRMQSGEALRLGLATVTGEADLSVSTTLLDRGGAFAVALK